MRLENKTIGVALTGSFCTFENAKKEIKHLVDEGANVIPIFSYNAQTLDTKFGNAKDHIEEIINITGNKPLMTIPEAEPIGPTGYLDVLVVLPCTGNTLAKFTNGITDTPVLMAMKAHVRNEKPLVISLATNDAMGANFKNIGMAFNLKYVYFVPFGQDNYIKKPASIIAHTDLVIDTIEAALNNKQIQPVLR